MTENEINLLDINQAYHDFFAFKCENLMEAYNTTIMAGMTAILLHVFMAILFKVFGGKIIGKDVNMAANIIVFGSRLISFQQVIKCIHSFISTKFENGRHAVRINKINNL